MQFNKRDLADAGISLMTIEQMSNELNRQLKVPAFPAAALNGMGVGKTLQECLRLVLRIPAAGTQFLKMIPPAANSWLPDSRFFRKTELFEPRGTSAS